MSFELTQMALYKFLYYCPGWDHYIVSKAKTILPHRENLYWEEKWHTENYKIEGETDKNSGLFSGVELASYNRE